MTLDKEILLLLKSIIKRSFYTVSDAQKDTNATRRQIMYRLEKLNQLIEDYELLPVVLGHQQEFLVDVETRDFLIQFLFASNEDITYHLNREERKIFIYLCLFVDREFLSLQHFMSYLDVSKSTLVQDLNELTLELSDQEIDLEYDRSLGYYLAGEEMNLRRHMMKNVIYSLSEKANSHVLDMFIDAQHLYTFDFSKLIIQELAQKHEISFVEDRLDEFIYIFIFLSTRIVDGLHVDKSNQQIPNVEMIKSFKEYEFTNELVDFFPFRDQIAELDRQYIGSWILGVSFGNIDDDTEDCLIIAQMVGKIMTRFELLSGVHYSNLEEKFRHIYAHFRPAYYRLLFKLPIVNPLKQRVIDEYPSLYSLVKETMKPFRETFGEEISDDEISYLTMHFASAYSQKNDDEIIEKKEALIICLNGIGSSVILYNELRSLFPSIDFLLPIEVSQFDVEQYNVDIIFTTRFFKDLTDVKIPVVKVSPIMDAQEKFTVYREVVSHLGEYATSGPRAEAITTILRKHLGEVPNEDQLVSDLMNTYLKVPVDLSTVEVTRDRLIDLLSEDTMHLQMDANNPLEAIEQAGQLLVKTGKVSISYLEAVLKSQERNPGYFVIAPHISLPHAKPNQGALDRAIAIATLKSPLNFGDSYNNPVKYIFFLAATDNETHLDAMSELLELFNDSTFLRLLENTTDKNKVLEYIRQIN